MTEPSDLKALEKKAYTTYHRDGIIDIFLGLAIATFGVLLLPIIMLGLVITVTGFVLLYQFLQKYPKVEKSEDLYEEWGDEGL